MPNFSIGTQVNKELEDFSRGRIKLASRSNEAVRYLKKSDQSNYFSQRDMLALIDLYYSSKFDDGETDKLGQRKIFMNVGKFRTDVAAKQIDIDVKDFKFIPDDYSDPWTSIFMQKDFKEWSKENYFGELINECVDALPKYGTVVLKKVGKIVEFVHLQLLRNEQSAKDLKSASYVIECHPDMEYWEIKDMAGWNSDNLDMKYGEKIEVYERYGHVPVEWLNKVNKEEPMYVPIKNGKNTVDALVILAFVKKENGNPTPHIFFAGEIQERPYQEVHWSRQYGRWLGAGVMEDLIENQVAKNIIVNLMRRSLHWSSKRIGQTERADATAKNLAMDVKDGEVVEVGQNGEIKILDLSSRSQAEFQQFLSEFERNSDQKAFTYEVSTGESMPSGTPFRLGVITSNAVNAYFGLKREKLGLFLKRVIEEFQIPEFLKDMGNEERVVGMFGDEPGFEVLKDAAMQYVRSETARISLMAGVPVDISAIESSIEPFKAMKQLFFKLDAKAYKNAKYKFQLTVTGEEINLEAKLETLKALYFSMIQSGDSRSEKVLERITMLAGENMALFGPAGAAQPSMMTGANVNPSGANGGGNPGGANTTGAARAVTQ